MPRNVCFLALDQHILLFDHVYNIDDDIADGASGNAEIRVFLFQLLYATDDFDNIDDDIGDGASGNAEMCVSILAFKFDR